MFCDNGSILPAHYVILARMKVPQKMEVWGAPFGHILITKFLHINHIKVIFFQKKDNRFPPFWFKVSVFYHLLEE